MSDCEFYRELIDKNLEGECSAEEMLLLNEHLKECPACKEEARFAFNVQNTLRSLPKMEAPDNFLMSLNEKIDCLDNTKPEIKFNRVLTSWKKYSALTACLLLAVLVKINVWDIPDSAKINKAEIEETSNITVSQAEPEATQEPEIIPVENKPVSEEVSVSVAPSKKPMKTEDVIKEEQIVSNPEKQENKVYVVKAGTPHSKTKSPEYTSNSENVVVLDSAPKNQRVNLDDYKIMVTDEFLHSCYGDDIPSNKVIVATPTNVSSAKSVNIDTSSLNVSNTSNGAGSGSLLVSADDEKIVEQILSKYSVGAPNNTFMLSSENYNSFINELQSNGIKYRDYMIHSGANVAFQLIVS